MRKNIWFPIIIISLLWLVVISGAYSSVAIRNSNNTLVIVLEPSFSFYSDQESTHPIDKISLREFTQGSITNFTFYVKNNSTVSQTVSVGNFIIPASMGTITMTFDGESQKTLAMNAVARVDGTLTVLDQVQPRANDITVLFNAVPATTNPPISTSLPSPTAILPTTMAPATSTPVLTTRATLKPTPAVTTIPITTTQPALSGQVIYNANCLSCHRSSPATRGLTQAQLSTFIANHQSGRNLTKEQIAAIVFLLKP